MSLERAQGPRDPLPTNQDRCEAPTTPLALASEIAGLQLWLCGLERKREEIEDLTEWLSPAERARSLSWGTDALRHRWIAGRTTLRLLLGRVLGVPPAVVDIRRGIRGRPELADANAGIDFNVSHTGDAALFGIARGLPRRSRIGVDIERRDRRVGVDRLARKFLTDNERSTLADLDLRGRRARFVHYWTCKEAMSKATGDGLRAPFGRIDVELRERPRLADGPPPYAPAEWTLHDAAAPEPWVATIAIWRAAPAVTP